MNARTLSKLLLIVLTLGLGLVSALAQEANVTADDVNAIAKNLYCPVCENIPLDACGTAACADWRNEIRLQLESGMSEAEITADFVRRFGDRVVGTPQDPILRALSLATPWLLILGGLGLGAAFLLRTQRSRAEDSPLPLATTPYHEQLERDLRG